MAASPFSSLAEQARVLLRKLRRVKLGAVGKGKVIVDITPGNQHLAAGKQCRGVALASPMHVAGYGP